MTRVTHFRIVALAAAAGLTPLSVLAFEPVAAARQARPVEVTFVLEPTWLPSGYSTTGGGWVKPPGGLQVSPDSGVGVAQFEIPAKEGSNSATSQAAARSGTKSTQALFTLSYFGFHNPESKSIRLVATTEPSPSFQPHGGTVQKLNGRRVTITSYTQGIFHNIVAFASWDERGDLVTVATQGLTTNQVARFISGLTERKPPQG